jgi:type II secretory pathway pseudopilin PulG
MFNQGEDSKVSRAPAAFTLAEVIIALTLAGIVFSGVVTLIRVQKSLYVKGALRTEAVQRARYVVDFLERELRLAGSGTLPNQPVIVYGDDDAVVFNVDLVTRDRDDAVAVYYDPDAPVSQTVGPDSGALTLPNGTAYPKTWYGPNRTPGRAETVTLRFAPYSASRYALVRQINTADPDTLLKELERPVDGFFSYYTTGPGSGGRELPAPLVHDEPIHGGPGDTARSARTDSIRAIRAAFIVVVQNPQGAEKRIETRVAVAPRNMGLTLHASCGQRPIVPAPPSLALTPEDKAQVTWPPAFDETGGERDVRQYNLYRAESSEGPWIPVQTLPIAGTGSYTYEDTSVEPGKAYWYGLAATDCTPVESEWAIAGPIAIPPQP